LAKESIVNGVNVDKIFETIDSIKGNSDIAKFRFKATNKWIKGGENRTTINEFYGACKTHSRSKPFEFVKDEPPVLLGEDHGANPVEYALSALAGCLTTSLVYHAAASPILHPSKHLRVCFTISLFIIGLLIHSFIVSF